MLERAGIWAISLVFLLAVVLLLEMRGFGNLGMWLLWIGRIVLAVVMLAMTLWWAFGPRKY
jgi:hypothetical protein